MILFIAFFLLVGLFYSFSRSSIIILSVCYIIYLLRESRYLIYFLIIILLAYLLLDTLGGIESLSLLFSGYDPSTSGHIFIIEDAYKLFARNFWGTGLGSAGVIVRRFIEKAPQFEGDFFNLVVQMGIFGFVFYLVTYILALFKSFKQSKGNKDPFLRDFSFYVFLIIVALILRDMILPRDQMNFWYGWFLIGLNIVFINLEKYENSVYRQRES